MCLEPLGRSEKLDSSGVNGEDGRNSDGVGVGSRMSSGLGTRTSSDEILERRPIGGSAIFQHQEATNKPSSQQMLQPSDKETPRAT